MYPAACGPFRLPLFPSSNTPPLPHHHHHSCRVVCTERQDPPHFPTHTHTHTRAGITGIGERQRGKAENLPFCVYIRGRPGKVFSCSSEGSNSFAEKKGAHVRANSAAHQAKKKAKKNSEVWSALVVAAPCRFPSPHRRSRTKEKQTGAVAQ